MQFKINFILPILLCASLVAVAPASSQAQQNGFADAESAINAALELLQPGGVPETSLENLTEIRAILDVVVRNFPASDYAVKILFQDSIGTLDVAALDFRLLDAATPAQEQEAQAPNEASELEKPEPPAAVANPPVQKPAASEANADAAEPAPTKPAPLPAVERAETMPSPLEPPVPQLDPARFEQDVRDLGLELHQCFLRNSVGDDFPALTVQFSVSETGAMIGMPTQVRPDGTTSAIRRAFLNAVVAIDGCGPYPPQYSRSEFEAEFFSAGLLSLTKLTPPPPKPEWKRATAKIHKALKLQRMDVAEIQARLLASGFDPNGVDGSFGKGTRGAISAWQTANVIPSTGYLDAPQHEELKRVTQSAFDTWKSDSANANRLARAGQPRARPTVSRSKVWYRRSDGKYCRRLVIGTWCQTNRPRN